MLPNPHYSPLMKWANDTFKEIKEVDSKTGLIRKIAQLKMCKSCRLDLPADTRFFKQSFPRLHLRSDCRSCEYKKEYHYVN